MAAASAASAAAPETGATVAPKPAHSGAHRPSHLLRSRAALNAAALQRALHPHLLTARSAWRWPLPSTPHTTATAAVPASHRWLARSRAAAALADPPLFAFVSRGGAAALARPGAGVRVLRVPAPHTSLARRAVSVALFTLPPDAGTPAGGADRKTRIAAVGFASGAVAFFDARTASFRVLSRPVAAEVRRLRFHVALHWGRNSTPPTGGLFGVAGTGELCLLPATQILSLLRLGRGAEPTARGWTLWTVPSRGHLNDAAPLGAAAASICEVDRRGEGAPLRVAAAGAAPAIIAYECSRDPIFSARAAAKKAASSVYSFARGLFSSPPSNATQHAASEDDFEDAPRVVAAATPGPAWTDHAPEDRAFQLPNVKGVSESARKSVTAVLAAPARVFRYSAEGTTMGRATEEFPENLEDDTRREALGDADPAHGSMDAEYLRALLAERDGVPEARPSMNARVAERIAAAPLACGLLAAADNLGRVLVQDARDMVTLRVLKGYRDAQVAWLAPDGDTRAPLLAVLAPRLNILELHAAVSGKRVEAFRVPQGARLLQTPNFHIFCIAPSGALYEITAAAGMTFAPCANEVRLNGESAKQSTNVCASNGGGESGAQSPVVPDVPQPPDEETVAAFLEAARSENVVRATDMLQALAREPAKVAHLMARLLVSDDAHGGVTADVHVALAARAANLASAEGSVDLEMRYFAHGRLAESYGLLTFDVGDAGGGEQGGRSKRLLRDDALGAGLADSAALERSTVGTRPMGKRLSVEEFILAHSITPSSDFEPRNSFTLLPRMDLTDREKEVVAHTYFSRLLDGAANAGDAGPGGEATGSRDVFLALRDLHALPVAEIATIFVTFFLTAPLDALLATPVALHASALRCVLGRLRASGSRKLVDEVILSACESATAHAVNAVLLARLCAVSEDDSGDGAGGAEADGSASLGRFLHVLALLDEVLLLRRLVAGTSVAADVVDSTAAQDCAGGRGTAERRAVTLLLERAEYAPAANVLDALLVFRQPKLEWHESSVVSEEAIQICRARTAAILDERLFKVILPAVAHWIRAAKPEQDIKPGKENTKHLLGIRTVMLAAHAHVPDASVDAVRCLQLAEAMTAVMMACGNGEEAENSEEMDASDMEVSTAKDGDGPKT